MKKIIISTTLLLLSSSVFSDSNLNNYINRQTQLTNCVNLYSFMRDIEIAKINKVDINVLIKDINSKKELNEQRKFDYIGIIKFIYREEKVGFSEVLLKNCLVAKSVMI